MSETPITYIELHGVEPADIPHGVDWDGETIDAASELANDIHQLIQEDYPFDADGVATVVQLDAHRKLNNAFEDNE